MLKNAEQTEVKAVLKELVFNGGTVDAPSGACFPPRRRRRRFFGGPTGGRNRLTMLITLSRPAE